MCLFGYKLTGAEAYYEAEREHWEHQEKAMERAKEEAMSVGRNVLRNEGTEDSVRIELDFLLPKEGFSMEHCYALERAALDKVKAWFVYVRQTEAARVNDGGEA